MKILDIITESKTTKAEAPKPRNFVAKNAINTGAGAHKDKKKAAKQGEVKHKKKEFAEAYGRYDRRDAYQRDYDHSIAGMNRGRGEIDDEANLMYIYKDGRLKQRMVDNHEERSARAEGFRDTQTKALALHNIIRSKFDPNKWVQKQGNKWVQVYPFGEPKPEPAKEDRVDEKAVSKAQQKFMGMVYAAKKGEKPASPEVAKVAKGMSKKSAKDYAATKHKGKPEHVKETATAGSTSAGNVAVGAVYKNKKPKMQKPGTNALDMKGGNLMTGGSLVKR